MNIHWAKFYCRVMVVSIVVSVGACQHKTDDGKSLEHSIRSAVEDLYLGDHGLDYPHTRQVLEQCQKDETSSCFRVFRKVETAIDTIRSAPAAQALPIILTLIKTNCGTGDAVQSELTCHGALMALYFFDKPDQDKEILAAVRAYSRSIQNVVFNGSFAWFGNRPNRAAWAEYISAAEIDWTYSGSRQQVLASFHEQESSPPSWISNSRISRQESFD